MFFKSQWDDFRPTTLDVLLEKEISPLVNFSRIRAEASSVELYRPSETNMTAIIFKRCSRDPFLGSMGRTVSSFPMPCSYVGTFRVLAPWALKGSTLYKAHWDPTTPTELRGDIEIPISMQGRARRF